MDNILFAFSLTIMSSMFMLIGAFIGINFKKNEKFFCFSLGFSGGVMLYLAFTEILAKGQEYILNFYPGTMGNFLVGISFFIGMIFFQILNYLVSDHDSDKVSPEKCLYKMGILSAISIGIHNFPEGITIFLSALEDPKLGFSVSASIAIHNISIGMAIAIPIYVATSNKFKSYFFTLISAITSPLGALVAFIFLKRHLNGLSLGILFSSIAGLMVFICLDEILPTAEKFGKHHLVISGVISGMLIIALSLLGLDFH